MYSKVYSAGLNGLEAQKIIVEADVSGGLPSFQMVGLLASAVKEARERVRISLQNSGVIFPPKRITVNLSPADIRKDGSGFDLPIAISLVAAFGMIPISHTEHMAIAGELSLDGRVHGIHGALSMAIVARESGFSSVMLPTANVAEASFVEGIDVIGVQTLKEAIAYLRGEIIIPPAKGEWEKTGGERQLPEVDFSEISGQKTAKKAAETAVAGAHNLLMVGAPGTGKTLLAKALVGVMPPLSRKEMLELTKIYSVAGRLDEKMPVILQRPFRAPHHSISPAAFSGGGSKVVPGEITLAQNGILFLDELPEFSRTTLEILRQPMEEGKIHLSRLGHSFEYPAKMMVVGAMNPCRCGFYPDMQKCRCTPLQVQNYLARLSEPLLDRMDLCVEMEKAVFGLPEIKEKVENSEQIRSRILAARERQERRYRKETILYNSELDGKAIEKYCSLPKNEKLLWRELCEQLELSARGAKRLLRVARTLADLSEREQIREEDLFEASLYKGISRKYWNSIPEGMDRG